MSPRDYHDFFMSYLSLSNDRFYCNIENISLFIEYMYLSTTYRDRGKPRKFQFLIVKIKKKYRYKNIFWNDDTGKYHDTLITDNQYFKPGMLKQIRNINTYHICIIV